MPWWGWAALGIAIIPLSWGALGVAAKRLPPGVLKDAATVVAAMVVTARRLRHDPRVPRAVRVAVMLALAWTVSPIDLIPEFIPILGPLDDVIVIALALRFAARRVPYEAIAEAWPGDHALLTKLLRRTPRMPETRPLR